MQTDNMVYNNDLKIIMQLNKIFNVKNVPTAEPNVLAALITAASKMGKVSNVTSEELVIEQLLDVYKKNDDEEVTKLIGMGPQYVSSVTGYAVDFSNLDSARMAYQSNKETYDRFYSEVNERAMRIANDIQR